MHTDTGPSADALSASITALIAIDDAFFEASVVHGLSLDTRAAMRTLRLAGDFLQQAATAVATGSGLASPEVVTPFRWAVMKVAAFNAELPRELRGDLSRDCFQAKARRN